VASFSIEEASGLWKERNILERGLACAAARSRSAKGMAMDKDNKRSHQDKAHGYDKNEERLNPGMNSEGAGGAGADPTKPRDGGAAEKFPLGSTDGEQAGNQRDPKHRSED
jgi:hypothetical protein